MAKYAGPSTSAPKAEPKPYLDKFKAKPEDEEFFELLNNKNTSVILQKKNFFEFNQRGSSEVHKLYNRVCIFNLTELCTQTMQPIVAPFRVGILTAEGIKLRHDFQFDHGEEVPGFCNQTQTYRLPLTEFLQGWIRKDGLDAEVIKQFTLTQTSVQPGAKKEKAQPNHNFAAIRRQIEYYFGPKNYKKDHFLQKLADSDGWIPLKEVCEFNKMKQIKANLSACEKAFKSYQATNFEFQNGRVRVKNKV